MVPSFKYGWYHTLITPDHLINMDGCILNLRMAILNLRMIIRFVMQNNGWHLFCVFYEIILYYG